MYCHSTISTLTDIYVWSVRLTLRSKTQDNIGKDTTKLYGKHDFPFLSSNFSTSPAYISHLMRFARVCTGYRDPLTKVQLLTSKLHSREYVKLKLGLFWRNSIGFIMILSTIIQCMFQNIVVQFTRHKFWAFVLWDFVLWVWWYEKWYWMYAVIRSITLVWHRLRFQTKFKHLIVDVRACSHMFVHWGAKISPGSQWMSSTKTETGE